MKLDKYAVFCMFGMVLAVFSLVFGILGKGIGFIRPGYGRCMLRHAAAHQDARR